MTTLTGFLLARIADLEALARAVQAETLEPDAPIGTGDDPWPSERAFAEHITPARVLAECEAKRRIVAAFEDERVRRDIYNRDYDSGEYDFNENDLRARLASNAECRGLEIAMLAHATIYADHEDFDESWRP